MFCVNCGKELANDARFCSFCGAPVKDVIVRTAEPQKEAVAENETLNAEQPVSEEAVLTTEQAVPENEVSEEQPGDAALNAPLEEKTSLPTPNVIPTMGVGTSSPANANTPITENTNAVPAPEKPERRYTLGHIFICLAAVAVMAITAGVFAGLYFSVV